MEGVNSLLQRYIPVWEGGPGVREEVEKEQTSCAAVHGIAHAVDASRHSRGRSVSRFSVHCN